MEDTDSGPSISGLTERGNYYVSFRVEGVGDLDATYAAKTICPDRVYLGFTWNGEQGWELLVAKVSGRARVKSGALGRSQSLATWYSRKGLPAWLDQLVGRFLPSDSEARPSLGLSLRQ